MIKVLLIASLFAALVSCSSKSKKDADIKDQNVKTQQDKGEMISGGTTLGVNEDKEIIVQDKVQLNEHMRQLGAAIKSKQDELYGSKRFSSRGLYGKLEMCVQKVNKKNKGGDGASHFTLAAREIVVPDQELGQIEAGKFGYDERGQLVALDEAKLRDKIRDLEDKKRRLYQKEEELFAEMSRCEAQLD
jgi:hypothetical protein